MLALSLLSPTESNVMHKAFMIMFWILALIVTWRTLLFYGRELVNLTDLQDCM